MFPSLQLSRDSIKLALRRTSSGSTTTTVYISGLFLFFLSFFFFFHGFSSPSHASIPAFTSPSFSSKHLKQSFLFFPQKFDTQKVGTRWSRAKPAAPGEEEAAMVKLLTSRLPKRSAAVSQCSLQNQQERQKTPARAN